MYGSQIYGSFLFGSATATAGTAFTRLVEPWRGVGDGGPQLHLVDGNGILKTPSAYTHITQLVYADTGTVHSVVVLRPLNWTKCAAAVAHNSTALTITDDPGAFATTYKYKLGGGALKPAAVANNVAAASDYLAYQLVDGTWQLNTISSITLLAVTLGTATPNVAGGGIAAGTPIYFFGVAADSDPATGKAHIALAGGAGSTRYNLLADSPQGGIPSLHAGDPMLIYSANATNAGTLGCVGGYYANR